MSTPIDSSGWKEYSKIDPELEALLPHLPPPKSFADCKDANEVRQTVADQFGQLVQAGLVKFPDWTGYHREEVKIPTRDGHENRAIVYRPESKSPGPLYVYFHGGGWTFGMPEYGEFGAEKLVKELGFTVVSVGYRLAPEHVFPTAAHDAIDAVHWLAKNASAIGSDPTKGFIISGTSAGSNLAAVAAHEAVDVKLEPPVTGVVLMQPGLCHHDAGNEDYKKHNTSFEDNKDAMVLDRRGIDFLYDKYKPDPKSPLASPLIWKSHKGQPATYLQVMGMDPLRDEALIYEHVLREAGTPTKLEVYKGIPHGGPDFLPMHSVAKKALVDLKEGVEWILSQKA